MPIGNILLNRFDQESNEFGIEDSGEYEDFPQVNDRIINEMSFTFIGTRNQFIWKPLTFYLRSRGEVSTNLLLKDTVR